MRAGILLACALLSCARPRPTDRARTLQMRAQATAEARPSSTCTVSGTLHAPRREPKPFKDVATFDETIGDLAVGDLVVLDIESVHYSLGCMVACDVRPPPDGIGLRKFALTDSASTPPPDRLTCIHQVAAPPGR
jgi:hypothetical protein